MTGRGWGKTRTGAEWARGIEESAPDGLRGELRFALVGPTAADVRDTMIEGESGLLSVGPPWNRPHYEPSKRRVTWESGAQATAFSADEPERLRGPQHHYAWCDELAAWRYMQDAWDMLMFGLRLGTHPQVIVTTTPKPSSLLKAILDDATTETTYGSTYDNTINLAPAFAREIIARYEGTRLGRQELRGELLEDVPGALWTRAILDANRVREAPPMARIVVAVDPAVTSGEESDETGIVVAGKGMDGEGYVLADLTCRLSPDGWARRVVNAFDEHEADLVVAEVNNGGDLVEANVRTVRREIAYKAVRASRGKRVRAEPVSSLYEQGRVHHVGGFPELEDQQCNFVPDNLDESPDRVDALVWAFTELHIEPGIEGGAMAGIAVPTVDKKKDEDEAVAPVGLARFF